MSMWVGNLLLVVRNLPLIGLLVRMLRIPYFVLFPAILTFSAIGVYSINDNAFDLFAVAVFGLLGYVLVHFGCEPGFVLGAMLEEHLRRVMIIASGDPMIFSQRPISAVLLGLAVLTCDPRRSKARP